MTGTSPPPLITLDPSKPTPLAPHLSPGPRPPPLGGRRSKPRYIQRQAQMAFSSPLGPTPYPYPWGGGRTYKQTIRDRHKCPLVVCDIIFHGISIAWILKIVCS